jgi:hypothetical protein
MLEYPGPHTDFAVIWVRPGFWKCVVFVTWVRVRPQKDHVTKAHVTSLSIPNLGLTHQLRNVNVKHCPDQSPCLYHNVPHARDRRITARVAIPLEHVEGTAFHRSIFSKSRINCRKWKRSSERVSKHKTINLQPGEIRVDHIALANKETVNTRK